MMRTLLYLFVALGGAGLTVQAVWNARLRTATGSPILTVLISVFITFVCVLLTWLSGATGRGTVPAFGSIPKWAWFGGIFAGYYLLSSLIAVPRLGAAAVFSLVIAGQLSAAVILDATGAFGVPQIPLGPSRIVGVVLLLAGVALMQRR